MADSDWDKSFKDETAEENDVRLIPKSILRKFIQTYRAHPALWQIKNKLIYNNRNLKTQGYSELLKVWKNFDPDADEKAVRLKIQSLRSSFRKELKKVENSGSCSGDEGVYTSSLWYFNLMSFLKDDETVKISISNVETANTIFVKLEDVGEELYLEEDESEINEELEENLEDDKTEKMDIRVVPKSIIKKFIETYRAHPALWQVKNKQVYHNKHLKSSGYSALVNVWKNYDPDADQRAVRIKVQSLRSSFRKELRKVENSARSASGDHVYVSNLWYYNLMSFLYDHETGTKSIDNRETSNPISLRGRGKDRELDLHEDKFVINEKFNQFASYSDETSVSQAKKTRLSEEREMRHFIPKSIPALESKYDENVALGQYVSSKLNKVTNPEQRMYAEALLTKVLNKAILNKLHEFSDISDNYPSSAYISPSNFPATDYCTDAASIHDSD